MTRRLDINYVQTKTQSRTLILLARKLAPEMALVTYILGYNKFDCTAHSLNSSVCYFTQALKEITEHYLMKDHKCFIYSYNHNQSIIFKHTYISGDFRAKCS
jgi:hypothetical protein